MVEEVVVNTINIIKQKMEALFIFIVQVVVKDSIDNNMIIFIIKGNSSPNKILLKEFSLIYFLVGLQKALYF